MTIHLHVIGLPAPQGSKTRMPNGAMVDGTSTTGRANLAAWRQAVRAECRRHLAAHPAEPLAEPLRVTLDFSFPATKSDPYRFWHVSTPDADKLVRAVFDSLVQGGLLADDRYVCAVSAVKTYCDTGPAGCEVTIISLADVEAERRAHRKAQAQAARKAARAAG